MIDFSADSESEVDIAASLALEANQAIQANDSRREFWNKCDLPDMTSALQLVGSEPIAAVRNNLKREVEVSTGASSASMIFRVMNWLISLSDWNFTGI